MDKLIEIKSLYAGYDGETVIQDVNLTIYKNDFLGIIGPNGGGKTTLLKAILGLLDYEKGSIEFFFDKKKHSIGFLPQYNDIDKDFPITVQDVVLSGLAGKKGIFKKFSKEDRKKADALLEEMGVLELKNKSIGELSGGQMQRVFLCRAIISDPIVLILDEPNTYIDKSMTLSLYELLLKLNEKMAIVVVSHDVGVISSYIKNIACINKKLHYHPSGKINEDILSVYNCPVELISHGKIPHRVLLEHNGHSHNHEHKENKDV